ncbi:MAG: multidrug ABC transporter [Oscillospiraceae bacterium]|nr:multidrug ABC transporter [Oscillospiraceae bacterium]
MIKNVLLFHILILFLSVIIASFSQLLLKKEASLNHTTLLAQYLNLRVITAYVLLVVSTICSVMAFRVIPLTASPLAEAFGTITTLILSVTVLKEKITKRKLLGIGIVILGIIFIAID